MVQTVQTTLVMVNSFQSAVSWKLESYQQQSRKCHVSIEPQLCLLWSLSCSPSITLLWRILVVFHWTPSKSVSTIWRIFSASSRIFSIFSIELSTMSIALPKSTSTLCKYRLRGPVTAKISRKRQAVATICFVWKDEYSPCEECIHLILANENNFLFSHLCAPPSIWRPLKNACWGAVAPLAPPCHHATDTANNDTADSHIPSDMVPCSPVEFREIVVKRKMQKEDFGRRALCKISLLAKMEW